MFAVTNQDTFRYPSLINGTERLRLGMMLTTIALPGIPLLLYGDEQGFFLHDSRSENYIYGRQPMTSAYAWQMHGCYQGKAAYQFIDMPFSNVSRNGCHDDSQALDHFNQASQQYLFTQTLYAVHSLYPILRDAFRMDVMARIYLENSVGLWSNHRTYYPAQGFDKAENEIWILYTNSSSALSITDGCNESGKNFINTPSAPSGQFRDLFPPFESLYTTLSSSGKHYCLDKIDLPMFGYRVLISAGNFKPILPVSKTCSV